jgi:hypothetical protein
MDLGTQSTEHSTAVPLDWGFARGLYYEAEPETAENLRLMRLIDEQYTRTPFYGVRKMNWWLDEQGYAVNPKRVRRLMRQMGLEAIYRKPRLSKPAPGHRIYPYLLRGVKIDRHNQVWSSDITHIIQLRQGFIYLVAVMDWFSRYVLAWEVSVPWKHRSAWRRWIGPYSTVVRRFSISTRDRSSPTSISRVGWTLMALNE